MKTLVKLLLFAVATVSTAVAQPIVEFNAPDPGVARSLGAGLSGVLDAVRDDPAASDLRVGRFNPEAVASLKRTRALEFVDPTTGRTVTYTGVGVVRNANGSLSLSAADGESEVDLVVHGEDVVGSFRTGGETYAVRPVGGGSTAVYRYDVSGLRAHPPGWGMQARRIRDAHVARERERGVAFSVPPAGERDDGSLVDAMVVYNAAAARAVGGNMVAWVQNAVDNTNKAYSNSSIDFRLRVVHLHEVDYVMSDKITIDLMRLRERSDGHMDEIHDLRDEHGADLVVLVNEDSNGYCGLAYQIDPVYFPDVDWENSGFGVIAQNCEIGTNSTLAHEVGHLLGAHHNFPYACGGNGCNGGGYNYGTCNTEGVWHTVMSYGDDGEGNSCRETVRYFSSPIVDFRGVKTGGPKRDNRRMMLESVSAVANFRQSVYDPPPPPPSNTVTLPFVTAGSSSDRTVIRVVNHSSETGEVWFQGTDDRGTVFDRVSLELEGEEAVKLYASDLELGRKGLSGGIGRGHGNWRFDVSSDLDVEVFAFVRTPSRSMTTVHEGVREMYREEGEEWGYYVPFFRESRAHQKSFLRITNLGDGPAHLLMFATDDSGTFGDAEVQVAGAGESIRLTARELETGSADVVTGGWGAGEGSWRVRVFSNQPLSILSLIRFKSGALVNVSRGQAETPW